jgi:ABC-2 type transport system ATP-binding protein
MYAIEVEDLTKEFNGLVAVDHISFQVEQGEIFGLLGPNGAGKTTAINMLSTLIRPTSGFAKVAGFSVLKEKDRVRKSIGMIFQESTLDNRLTGKENLDFHARMYGMDKEQREQRVKEGLKLVELEDKASVLVRNYSSGMKRRLEIARGLIHLPKVLFLDEPTLGLDAQTRRHIWDYIKKLNEEAKVTLILTTHYMEEADFLCHRIAIMDHGKIVALDQPIQLKRSIGGDVITLEIEDRSAKDFKAKLKDFGWIKEAKEYDNGLSLTVSYGDKRIPQLIAIAQKEGVSIKSVNLHRPTLEDTFLHFTGRTIREAEASIREINQRKARRMRRGTQR